MSPTLALLLTLDGALALVVMLAVVVGTIRRDAHRNARWLAAHEAATAAEHAAAEKAAGAVRA